MGNIEMKKMNSGWIAFLVSGLVALGYGVAAIMLTEDLKPTFLTIMRILGICIAVVGVLFLVAAIVRINKKLPWGLTLLEAIALITIGVLSSVYNQETLKLLSVIIGVWSAIVGAFMLLVLFHTKGLYNKGFFIGSATMSIAFGLLLILLPFGTKQWFMDLSGIIAVVFGVIMMMFAYTMRSIDKEAAAVQVVE